MHHRAQPERRRLAAQNAKLLFRERRTRADTLALRREDLDQIRALLLSPSHERAE
jgi:hypothetical protein